MEHITTVAELGKIIRAKREEDQLTQFEVACICGVGIRFLSELENGKPTVEFTKVLKVLHCLGLKSYTTYKKSHQITVTAMASIASIAVGSRLGSRFIMADCSSGSMVV